MSSDADAKHHLDLVAALDSLEAFLAQSDDGVKASTSHHPRFHIQKGEEAGKANELLAMNVLESIETLKSLNQNEVHLQTKITNGGQIGALFDSILALRDDFHNEICVRWLIETVMSRLDVMDRRVRRLQLKVRALTKNCPITATSAEDMPQFHQTPLLIRAMRRHKEQRAILKSIGSERPFGLQSTQRPSACVGAFVEERMEPLRKRLYIQPTQKLVQQTGAARCLQQSIVSQLSRVLHEERDTLVQSEKSTNQLASYAKMGLEHAGHVVGEFDNDKGVGAQMSAVLTNAVLKRLGSETGSFRLPDSASFIGN